jgi:DNA-binding transcriptional ArsR family regulator
MVEMSDPGTEAGRGRPLDADLAKALSHPLRQRILEHLSEGGETSPARLAHALRAPLANVAYHVRILHRLGCLELVRTQPRRGALEHYYRATARPWLDDAQWALMPAALRREALSRIARDVFADACAAGASGGFDHAGAQASRVLLELDPQGQQDIAALLGETLSALRHIANQSAARTAERERGPAPIHTEIALLHFRRAD